MSTFSEPTVSSGTDADACKLVRTKDRGAELHTGARTEAPEVTLGEGRYNLFGADYGGLSGEDPLHEEPMHLRVRIGAAVLNDDE